VQKPAVFVPHFHWDREWYESFQVFRHRLVAALDTVLTTAEADADFRFTVDGQMAAIEDYLEMRPENRDRVAALVERGRLAVGPWLILLDEFLCEGETIVRNLQMGWAATEIPAPGAQDLGVRIENRFAVLPSRTGWRGAGAVALAEVFRNDVLVARGTAAAGGELPPHAAGVRVDGPDVLVSSVRRVADGGTEVRLVAMNDTGSTARVTGAFAEATTVDLLGRPLSAAVIANSLDLGLGPWEIRTVVLR
jgi:alpha-mannosidase